MTVKEQCAPFEVDENAPSVISDTFLKRIVFIFVVVAIAPILLSGCGRSVNYEQPPDMDITTSPEYNFSSFSGTVWKTKVKVALASFKEYTGVIHVYLFVPNRFDTNQPDYTPLHDMEVIDVLPSGTRLRIGQLIQDNGIGSQLWVTATLLGVTNSQENVYLDHLLLANNRSIALGPSSSTNWGVSADMLEVATNAP